MTSILRQRGGLPRFARLLREREPATMVAFGTSLTLAGAYLDRLPGAVAETYPGVRLTTVNRGRNGYMTLGAAFRVAGDVLPHVPDLVLIEFAHNDVTQVVIDYITSALEGMIAQIRRVSPQCEFAFVYLALPGLATEGPTAAMLAYEHVAEHYSIPSIDLARLSEDLIANGDAIWYGDESRALTVDGIHHGPAAARLLGEPFAAAFVELLAGSGTGPAAHSPPPGSLATVARVRAADYRHAGEWNVRPTRPEELRGAGIDEEGLAEALAIGATVRVTFNGTNAFIWVSGSGVLGVRVNETDERYRVGVDAVEKWQLLSLIETHAAARYTLDIIALHPGMLLGDIGIIGTLE